MNSKIIGLVLCVLMLVCTSNVVAVPDGYVWVDGASNDWNTVASWVYYSTFAPAAEVPAPDAAFAAVLADLTAFGGGPVAQMPVISAPATTATTELYVGYGPTGQANLDIQAAGSLTLTGTAVAGLEMVGLGGGDGIINVDGTLNAAGITSAAGAGSVGLVTIGGNVTTTGYAVAAQDAGSTGVITVENGGTLNSGLGPMIGNGGHGTLNIDQGGTLASSENLAVGSGSVGIANIDGVATMTGTNYVGLGGGNGTETISATGSLSSADTRIGDGAGATGVLNVA